MKQFHTAAAALAFMPVITCAALADNPFPFARSFQSLDLAEPGALASLEKSIERAGRKRLIYLDWHLGNFSKSELFASFAPEAAADATEANACEAAKKPNLTISGRPNPENNHLLASFEFGAAGAPFVKLACEQFPGLPLEGLRIKGFFYVDDTRIATANQYDFKPVEVEPSAIPGGFLK